MKVCNGTNCNKKVKTITGYCPLCLQNLGKTDPAKARELYRTLTAIAEGK